MVKEKKSKSCAINLMLIFSVLLNPGALQAIPDVAIKIPGYKPVRRDRKDGRVSMLFERLFTPCEGMD